MRTVGALEVVALALADGPGDVFQDLWAQNQSASGRSGGRERVFTRRGPYVTLTFFISTTRSPIVVPRGAICSSRAAAASLICAWYCHSVSFGPVLTWPSFTTARCVIQSGTVSCIRRPMTMCGLHVLCSSCRIARTVARFSTSKPAAVQLAPFRVRGRTKAH